ncbi:hypothetical protein E3226_007570 [Legionella geestiana]|uniref:hypothetical protein n=1 Tax=Legionella geestiana TaxID=45065 RepID=UPI0010928D33|nr:hypothetical protein [Legionella geestiana]QDQ40264.1 hypothetical protein E3226_007570 [Legionella geestiana]
MDLNTIILVVATLLAAAITFFLDKFFHNRANLDAFLLHAGTHYIRDPEGLMHTHAFVIRNTGRVAARNVRICTANLPFVCCTVYPPIENKTIESDGSRELIFPILVPGEMVTISYLYFPPFFMRDFNTTIKSDEGFATVLNLIPAQQRPKWFEAMIMVLTFVGGVTILYLLAKSLVFFYDLSHAGYIL